MRLPLPGNRSQTTSDVTVRSNSTKRRSARRTLRLGAGSATPGPSRDAVQT
jgi:hypothetical protein